MRRLALALIAALLFTPALAGTLPISWSPVTATDLAGYRIYWGTVAGTYTTNVDVGIVTSTTLTGLPDCKDVFVAVKARDAAGNVSTNYSNVLQGWASVIIDAAPQRTFEIGGSYNVTVMGANFKPGTLAYLDFGASRINATGVTVTCNQLSFTVPTSTSTPVGLWSLSVENTDATWRQLQGFAATVANGPPPDVTGTKRDDKKL